VRAGQAAVLAAEHPRLRAVVTVEQAPRPGVGGAVVDDEDLEVLEGLGQDAGDRLVQDLAVGETRQVSFTYCFDAEDIDAAASALVTSLQRASWMNVTSRAPD
jgi:hypothetical protein